MSTSAAPFTFENYTWTWLKRGLAAGATVGAAIALTDPTGASVVGWFGLGSIAGTMMGFLVSILSPGVYNR